MICLLSKDGKNQQGMYIYIVDSPFETYPMPFELFWQVKFFPFQLPGAKKGKLKKQKVCS
jgi:hypothetical protein